MTNQAQISEFLITANNHSYYRVGATLSKAVIDHLGTNKFVSCVVNLSWLSYDTAYKLSSIDETTTFFKTHQSAIKEWLLRLESVPTSEKLILPSGYGTRSDWKGEGDLLDYISDSLHKVARTNFNRGSIEAVIFNNNTTHYDYVLVADAMTKFISTVVGAGYQSFMNTHYPTTLKLALQ